MESGPRALNHLNYVIAFLIDSFECWYFRRHIPCWQYGGIREFCPNWWPTELLCLKCANNLPRHHPRESIITLLFQQIVPLTLCCFGPVLQISWSIVRRSPITNEPTPFVPPSRHYSRSRFRLRLICLHLTLCHHYHPLVLSWFWILSTSNLTGLITSIFCLDQRSPTVGWFDGCWVRRVSNLFSEARWITRLHSWLNYLFGNSVRFW